MALITQQAIDKLARSKRQEFAGEEEGMRDKFDLAQTQRRAKGEDTLAPQNEFEAVDLQRKVQRQRDLNRVTGGIRADYARMPSVTGLFQDRDIIDYPASMGGAAKPGLLQLQQFSREKAAAAGRPWGYLEEIKAARASRGQAPESAIAQYGEAERERGQEALSRLEGAGRPPSTGVAPLQYQVRYGSTLSPDLRKEFFQLSPGDRAKVMGMTPDQREEILKQTALRRSGGGGVMPETAAASPVPWVKTQFDIDLGSYSKRARPPSPIIGGSTSGLEQVNRPSTHTEIIGEGPRD